MKFYRPKSKPTQVSGVRLQEMKHVPDPVRGHLTVGEFASDLPFLPQRYFLTFQVPSQQTRGEHAHRTCAQFLVCVHGSCKVSADDGVSTEEFVLDRPTLGLYVPSMIWTSTYAHSPDSVLMVLASHAYDPEDYICDYPAFLLQAQELTSPRPVL